MGPQPVGATGTNLGAIALDKKVEETKMVKEVPCYVSSYEKPIGRGELFNCGLVLGTNALVSLGFKVTHSNGTKVPAQPEHGESQLSTPVTSVLQVTAERNLRLGPGQTRTVCVNVSDCHDTFPVGIVSAVLAELERDFVEQLWQQGEATSHVRVTN